jgi:hypothetical protein
VLAIRSYSPNSLNRFRHGLKVEGAFDSPGTSLREVPVPLKMTARMAVASSLARRLPLLLRRWCWLALGTRGALMLGFWRALSVRGRLMGGGGLGLRSWRFRVFRLFGLGCFGFSLRRTFFMRSGGFGFSM